MLPPLPSLMLFLLAAFLLTLTPGPDMLFVFARSVGQGRAVGVNSALGVAVGSLLQAGLVALGLSSVLVAVPLAYEVIKDAGAIYLAYLGIRTFLGHEQALSSSSSQERRRWRPPPPFVKANKKKPKAEEKKPRKKREAQYNHARQRSAPLRSWNIGSWHVPTVTCTWEGSVWPAVARSSTCRPCLWSK